MLGVAVQLVEASVRERPSEVETFVEGALGKAMVVEHLVSLGRRLGMPSRDESDESLEHVERRAAALRDDLDALLRSIRSEG